MKVLDVMTTEVVTVEPGTAFKEIVERLLSAGVSSLPVVDAAGRLGGIVTEADLVSKEAFAGRRRRPLQLLSDLVHKGRLDWVDKAEGLTARSIMTAPVLTVTPSDDLRRVARVMVEKGLKRMPVVLDGMLVGIVSRRDILALFHRTDADILADIEANLRCVAWTPEDADVHVQVADGIVRAAGSVRHPSDLPLVDHAIWVVAGVIDVISTVAAREPDPTVAGPAFDRTSSGT